MPRKCNAQGERQETDVAMQPHQLGCALRCEAARLPTADRLAPRAGVFFFALLLLRDDGGLSKESIKYRGLAVEKTSLPFLLPIKYSARD